MTSLSEVTLMQFPEELGHSQLFLNLFQIQRTRLFIDTDVSPDGSRISKDCGGLG